MNILATQDIADDLAFRVAIRQSEIRYRRLFEAAHDGVLILDSVSRKITDANPFMSHLLGYRHDELLGKELWEIGLLKDEQASQAAFRELQNSGHVRYEDLPLESKSGEKREVEVVANRYDEDGTQVVQCNVRDITERKKTEGALRVSEERFRTLFETGSLGRLCLRCPGRYSGLQPTCYGIVGPYTGPRRRQRTFLRLDQDVPSGRKFHVPRPVPHGVGGLRKNVGGQ